MIYFDKFETWAQSFSNIIEGLAGQETLRKLASQEFEFIEDAGSLVVQAAGIREASTRIRDWIAQNEFCVFHGTRLLLDEISSLKSFGLRPLVASQRAGRLKTIFSEHEDWSICEGRLARAIEELGPGKKFGGREGQVHFSLSWSGLVNGFDHYVVYGSEFDQHVSRSIFKDNSGMELLNSKTLAYVVHVRMTGGDLLAGAHPHFAYDDIVERGEVPGLGLTFLNAWAFKQSVPDYDLSRLRTDCCMMLRRSIMPEDIVFLEKLDH